MTCLALALALDSIFIESIFLQFLSLVTRPFHIHIKLTTNMSTGIQSSGILNAESNLQGSKIPYLFICWGWVIPTVTRESHSRLLKFYKFGYTHKHHGTNIQFAYSGQNLRYLSKDSIDTTILLIEIYCIFDRMMFFIWTICTYAFLKFRKKSSKQITS